MSFPHEMICLPLSGRLPSAVLPAWFGSRWVAAAAGGLFLLTQSGCTALLSAGGLQEAMRELGDRPSMATYEDDSDADVAAEPVSSGDVPLEEISSPSTDQTADVAAAEKSFDEAIDRLAESGRLTPATEEALDAAIAGAPPQDWPDIIAAFVSGIESTPRPRRTALRPLEEPVAATATPAPQEPVPPASQPSPSPAAPAVTAPPVSVAPSATAPPREPQPPSRPPLALVNPCFASRVQGWGAVDRFASSRFLPGQELIVYFELEHLEIGRAHV